MKKLYILLALILLIPVYFLYNDLEKNNINKTGEKNEIIAYENSNNESNIVFLITS
jgi:hypothetical protein